MDRECKQCKECICNSCEQVAWLEPELQRARAEIEKLKAENEKLKEEIKNVKF